MLASVGVKCGCECVSVAVVDQFCLLHDNPFLNRYSSKTTLSAFLKSTCDNFTVQMTPSCHFADFLL